MDMIALGAAGSDMVVIFRYLLEHGTAALAAKINIR
jgi:hypothetical protein